MNISKIIAESAGYVCYSLVTPYFFIKGFVEGFRAGYYQR